jgi:hypothetical protein
MRIADHWSVRDGIRLTERTAFRANLLKGTGCERCNSIWSGEFASKRY